MTGTDNRDLTGMASPGAAEPQPGLAPRSAVVTGAGRGIGRGIAQALHEAGWLVIGVDHEATEGGPCAAMVIGDTRDREVHREAARQAAALAPLRGWVNNAGVTRETPLHELADPERAADVERVIREVVEINALGYMWGCAAAVESFLADGLGGAIVNIGSIHGRAAWRDHAAYELTKGGVDALTRSVAVTYGSQGIRANTIAPGRIRTEAIEASLASAEDPDRAERDLDTGPPLDRMGRPDEIGSVTAFLLSDQASYLTGQSMAVDGGWTAQFGNPPHPR